MLRVIMTILILISLFLYYIIILILTLYTVNNIVIYVLQPLVKL